MSSWRVIQTQIRERWYEGIDAPDQSTALEKFYTGNGHLVNELGSEWQIRLVPVPSTKSVEALQAKEGRDGN